MGRLAARPGALVVVVLVLAGGRAAAADVAPEPTAQQLREDLVVLQGLHRLALDAAVLTLWADQAKAIQVLRDQVRAQEDRPAVRAVLREIRAALVAGQPLHDDLRLRLEQAEREPLEGAAAVSRDALWEAARRAAQQLVDHLTPEQQSRLAWPDTEEWAGNLLRQVGEARNQPPDRFQAWTKELVGDLSRNRPDGQRLGENLLAFLIRVRGLTPDAFFAERDVLLGELVALLRPDAPARQRTEQAVGRLAEWLANNDRLAVCLADLAAARP